MIHRVPFACLFQMYNLDNVRLCGSDLTDGHVVFLIYLLFQQVKHQGTTEVLLTGLQLLLQTALYPFRLKLSNRTMLFTCYAISFSEYIISTEYNYHELLSPWLDMFPLIAAVVSDTKSVSLFVQWYI